MPAKKTDSSTLICASAPGKLPTIVRDSAHQPVGDAAHVHQVGGQQEERHREQDERVVGLERLVEEHHRRQPRLDQQHRQAREPERERDRHAQRRAARRTRRTGSAAADARRERAPRSSRALSAARGPARGDCRRKRSPRNSNQVTPASGQATKINHIGSSASSEVWSQPKLHELDAPPDEHQREHQHEHAARRCAAARCARGLSSGQTSTSKCVPSRTPTIAPSITIQMKRKRAISSVQM